MTMEGKASTIAPLSGIEAPITQFSKSQHWMNFTIMVAVSLPMFLAGYLVNSSFCLNINAIEPDQDNSGLGMEAVRKFCYIGLYHPMYFTNIAFFLLVCIVFWLISLFQRSTWLIDPYWTFLPPMLGLFYIFHPLGTRNEHRSYLTFLLLLVWSARLTHSYFRREEWNCGMREDWRFSDKRKEMGKHWWWCSLFYAFVSQQPMLVGLCFPLFAVNFEEKITPLSPIEVIFVIMCLVGIGTAFVADNQLYAFMKDNESRAAEGKPKVLLLEHGLWKYSRHPNYFGEQLWWWSLAGFSCMCGQYWTLTGPLFNSLVMAAVTGLTEARMLKNSKRHDAYKKYQKRTSVWIPTPWKNRPASKNLKTS